MLPPESLGAIAAEMARRNRIARTGWDVYAHHRARLSELLAGCGPKSSLCVLGAGNTNDLDLGMLSASFETLRLVDLDQDALEQGLRRQGMSGRPGIVLHGGVDLSGALGLLEAWNPDTKIGGTELANLAEAPAPDLSAPFDVVASTGLLTQLLDMVVLSLGAGHAHLVDAMAAVRLRHLRLLLQLLRPAGTAVLITEIVSSDSFPQLSLVPESELPQAIGREISRRNFFTGVNPGVLKALLENEPTLAPLVDRVEVSQPWRWQFTERMYAVCAFKIHRR